MFVQILIICFCPFDVRLCPLCSLFWSPIFLRQKAVLLVAALDWTSWGSIKNILLLNEWWPCLHVLNWCGPRKILFDTWPSYWCPSCVYFTTQCSSVLHVSCVLYCNVVYCMIVVYCTHLVRTDKYFVPFSTCNPNTFLIGWHNHRRKLTFIIYLLLADTLSISPLIG